MNPLLGEFIGTMLLVIFGDGVVANVVLGQTKGQNSGWIVIATGWAMAVAIGVYAVSPISGAHINPAVTIGLAVIGKFPWSNVAGYIIAQLLGAFVGGILVWAAYRRLPPTWTTTWTSTSRSTFSCHQPLTSRRPRSCRAS